MLGCLQLRLENIDDTITVNLHTRSGHATQFNDSAIVLFSTPARENGNDSTRAIGKHVLPFGG